VAVRLRAVELHVDDDGFVRAPAPMVYRRLTNIEAWNDWWPGVTAERQDLAFIGDLDPRPAAEATARTVDSDDREAWSFVWRDRLLAIRFDAAAGAWRHEHGFTLALSGDLEGRAEFWLEPGHGGTTIHHILIASTARRRPLRILTAYRRVLRQGLWRFKDRVQSDVRQAAGLAP
jgi:hypothetical protein